LKYIFAVVTRSKNDINTVRLIWTILCMLFEVEPGWSPLTSIRWLTHKNSLT